MAQLKKFTYHFFNRSNFNSLLLILFASCISCINTQNSCKASSANDRIFTGTANFASNLIKPGINTFTVAPGIISQLSSRSTSFNPSLLQISHNLKSISSSPNFYQITDFSLHSVVLNDQIKFLLLWNQANTTSINISLVTQFMVVYQRQQFVLGSFTIDTIQFILNTSQANHLYSRQIKFPKYQNACNFSNINPAISVQLYIAGWRFSGLNMNIQISNQVYNITNQQLKFSAIQNNNNPISLTNGGLYMLHISYIIFDRSTLVSGYKIYLNEDLQMKFDYWMKGLEQINLKQGNLNNLKYNELYLYKINRLLNNQTLQCISIDTCSLIKGNIIDDSLCTICPSGLIYNPQTAQCQLLKCDNNQTWNGTSCICKLGFVKIGTICSQCPQGSIYSSSTLSCLTSQCDQNQILYNGKCICSIGYVNITGICSNCPTGTIYNSLTFNCTEICTGNRRIFNGKCVCKQGYIQIGLDCGQCKTGEIYNPITKTCDSKNCNQNQVFINNKCSCNGPYINLICQPCSSDQTYDSATNKCIPTCPLNSHFDASYQACACNTGFYVIGDVCGICPTGTVYDYAKQMCQIGQTCAGVHQIYFSGYCICDIGYLRINYTCGICPTGTVYNEYLFDCTSNCSANQIYNSSLRFCQCNSGFGYYNISGSCQKCSSGTTYNSVTLECQVSCKNGQILANGVCVCPTGTYLIGSTCGLCQTGTIYNYSTLNCEKVCPDYNGYYQNGVCNCYPPYVVVNKTFCQQCPSGLDYDLSTQTCKNNTKPQPPNQNVTCNSTSEIKKLNPNNNLYYCACNQANGYYYIYDRCGTCQYFTKYNPQTLSCELNVSLSSNTSTVDNNQYTGPIVACSGANLIFQNGVCRCNSNSIKINNGCQKCPNNSSPNNLQTQCLCNNGYKATSNICVKIISQDSVVSCLQNEIWNGSLCVCVSEFYKINKICQRCPSLTIYNGNSCACQIGHYSQMVDVYGLPVCKKCHLSCLQCFGPNINQCLKCSNISSVLSNGKCIEQACQIGYYYQTYESSAKCQKCSSYCKECTSASVCTTCVDGFQIFSYLIGNNVALKICREICGDGKRYQRECDDGNKVSGDGCSKDCEVEDGFICVGGSSNKKDNCQQKQNQTKAIIQIRQQSIEHGVINQNVRLSYIPPLLQQNQCSICSNILKVSITSAKILPDSISVSFIQKSKYQFNVKFAFSGIFTIPIFKFTIQINPVYNDYFSQWDMKQIYEMEVDGALLSRKTEEKYLRVQDVV